MAADFEGGITQVHVPIRAVRRDTCGAPIMENMVSRNWKIYILALGTAAVLTLAASANLAFLLAIPALGVAYGLTKPWFRLVFFVLGALLVFQTGDGLSAPKVAYLGGVVVSVVAAVVSIHGRRDDPLVQRFKPSMVGATLLACWVLIPTLVQALVFAGVSYQMWARDALTYLLICAGVFIGLDACRAFTLNWARAVTVIIGLVAAGGFAAVWTQKRGFGESIENAPQGLLASIVAMTLSLALCLVLGLAQQRVRFFWLLLATVFIVAVLVTGTRTGFVLAIAMAGIWGGARKLRVPLHRIVVGVSVGSMAVALTLPLVGSWLSSEQFVKHRIELMLKAFQLGFSQDHSGVIRERAYSYSLEIFRANPVMGQGLGIYFPNPNPNAAPANFTLDTPAMYLAKFGYLGTAILLFSLALIIAPVISRRKGPWLLEITAVRGAIVTWIAILPFGPTTEDKGFAISVALAVFLVGAAHCRYMSSSERDDSQFATKERSRTVKVSPSRDESDRLCHAQNRVGNRN